jgi:flagellar protein FlgJ
VEGGGDVTRTEFIAAVAPVAVKVRGDGGPLFPSVIIAQAILETGGRIPSWNKIVGYKVGSGSRTPYWRGTCVRKNTWEMYDGQIVQTAADFRAYDNIEDCLKDQALLFLNRPQRYQSVIDATDPAIQAQALRACGYATDLAYADKLLSIIRTYGLEQYDREAKEAMEAIAQMGEELAALRREHEELRQRVQALQKLHQMDVPEWAEQAVATAAASGLVDTPDGGSLDFYRFLAVLYRAGLIPKKG